MLPLKMMLVRWALLVMLYMPPPVKLALLPLMRRLARVGLPPSLSRPPPRWWG